MMNRPPTVADTIPDQYSTPGRTRALRFKIAGNKR